MAESTSTPAPRPEKSLAFIAWKFIPSGGAGVLPGFCTAIFLLSVFVSVFVFIGGYFSTSISVFGVGLCFYIAGSMLRCLRNIEAYIYALCKQKKHD